VKRELHFSKTRSLEIVDGNFRGFLPERTTLWRRVEFSEAELPKSGCAKTLEGVLRTCLELIENEA